MVFVMTGCYHVHQTGGEQHLVYSPLLLTQHVILPGVAECLWVEVSEHVLQVPRVQPLL